jgi:8-hydroxy-5-deazaflavin:NADPH oxidoreductase
MTTGVLGTGAVGRTIAAKLAELGHDVVMGTRVPAETLRRVVKEDGAGSQLDAWLAKRTRIKLGTFAEAATHGDLVWNATSGGKSLAVLGASRAASVGPRILVDVANPLDFSRGMPPTLLVKDTDSLGEQIQREYPSLRVVKALNTMNAAVMTDPSSVAGGAHTAFMCGNDAEAKAEVRAVLESFGWRDVIDLGDITASRGMEMILPIWLRLFGILKTPSFNFHIAR